METINQTNEVVEVVVDSWNEERSIDQLRKFVTSRLAKVGEDI